MARIPKLTAVPTTTKRQSRYAEQDAGGAERQNLANIMRNLEDSKLELQDDVVAGSITVSSGGYMASGQTAYNTGTGFWIGNAAGTPKLSLGDSSANNITWDGTTLSVTGSITVADGSITAPKIATDAVTADKIIANAVTAGKIATDAVTADKIIANAVTAGKIATNAVTADKINVTSLSAINADMGTITAGTITLPSGGHVKSGQTAYDSGTGFYLGNDATVPKFSIGNSAGAKLTWDGTTLTVTYADGTAIESLKPAAAGADVTGANTALNTSNVGAQTQANVASATVAANAGLNSSGDLTRDVVANRVVTTSITDLAVSTGKVANEAITSLKSSPHMSASASPALQSANVLTWAYDGLSMIDISIAAGSKKAGATTASWGSGTVQVANSNATWAVYAVFGSGIGSSATSFGATTTLSDATAGATRVPLGTATVTAGGSGSGSGGGQIEP